MASDVKQLVRDAAEAAKEAPKHLQEAAFNKAFEALLAAEQKGTSATGPVQAERGTEVPTRRSAKRAARKPKSKGTGDIVRTVDKLNRTAHPEIREAETALANSLRLLRAAKQDLQIDGLTAATIARVLTEKFRCKVTRQAVGRALNKAIRYVNRHHDGQSVVFSIMSRGEKYLDQLREEKKGAGKTSSRSRSSRRKKASQPSKKTPEKKGQKVAKKVATRRRVGPAAALTQLSETGFFSSPRTISDITEHLKDRHGRAFKPNEISTPLLRFLRSGRLVRDKNPDNQYEYRQP